MEAAGRARHRGRLPAALRPQAAAPADADRHARSARLEQVIFPRYLADPRIKRVLFVGCDKYTAQYERRFFASHDYWTIEPDHRYCETAPSST